MTNYKITTSKPKIVIHCEWKEMTNDIVITNEIYMGEFEEISNGFTLTLNADDTIIADDNVNNYYSIDGGNNWALINSAQVVLENVKTIMFRTESSGYCLNVGMTDGGADIVTMLIYGDSEEITLTESGTWYVTHYIGGGYD